MTPTHIPPAMRGEGVPEWIVEVPPVVGETAPPFVRPPNGKRWMPTSGATYTAHHVSVDKVFKIKYARAATPTEITAARDGGRGDGR